MNIYVGNLSYQLSEDELKGLFEEFGTVTRANIIKDPATGRSKGFGFVEMESNEAGQEAIKKLDGVTAKDRQLKVNEARPKDDSRSSSRPQRRPNNRY